MRDSTREALLSAIREISTDQSNIQEIQMLLLSMNDSEFLIHTEVILEQLMYLRIGLLTILRKGNNG